MPIPIIAVASGDIVEVRLRSTYLGQQLITVMHYGVSSTGTSSQPFESYVNSLHDAITDAGGVIGWVGSINQLQIPACVMDYIEYQIVHPARQSYIQKAGLGAGQGATTGSPLPSNVSATFTLAPTQAKRGLHSTFKLGGLDSSFFLNNRVTNAAFNALVDLAGQMREPLTDGLSFTSSPGSVPKTAPFIIRQWAVGRVGQYAHVMRRRTAGLGI